MEVDGKGVSDLLETAFVGLERVGETFFDEISR